MQAKKSLAKQQAQLRADAKQKEEEQIQEEAHSMYLLLHQTRKKVRPLANTKRTQQSAPRFYSRIMQSSTTTLQWTKYKS